MPSRLTAIRTLAFAIATTLLLSSAAGAAEVRVMISGGLTAAYQALVPEFEKATGNKVITAYGPSMGNDRQRRGIPGAARSAASLRRTS